MDICIFGGSGWLKNLQAFSSNKAFEQCAPHTKTSKICWHTSKIATHQTSVIVNILGIERNDQGLSCKEHKICGSVSSTDVVLCLQKMQSCFLLDECDHHLFVPLVWFSTGWVRAVFFGADDAVADNAVKNAVKDSHIVQCCHCHWHHWHWKDCASWMVWAVILATTHCSPQLLLPLTSVPPHFFTNPNFLPHLQVQICNAGNKETALAAYLVMDDAERFQVDFMSRHLVKHGDKFDIALVQVTEVYNEDDNSN